MVAAAIAVWTMLHGAGGRFEWSWFYPWVLAPYLILGGLVATVGTRSKFTRVASIVATVAVLAASYLYVDAMFIHVSSTSALIYVFLPLYLLVGGLTLFALTALIGRRLSRPNDT
jgi:hypothetical protein